MKNIPNKKYYDISICSPPDREFLVAEIYFKNVQWVEIHHEEEEMKIQFYPHPNLPCWEFDLNEALEALAEAKRRLVAMGPKR